MSIDLIKARTQAEAHYASPSHRANSDSLRELIATQTKTLKRLHLALDLEGVLVNTPFPRELYSSNKERLKRPLAQELLDLLRTHAKQLTIWTASSGEVTEGIMQSSGLILPAGVKIIDRNRYILSLLRENTGGVGDLIWKIEHGEMELPSGTPEEIISHIKSCRAKIPKALSVDYLFDDDAGKHKEACTALGFPEDAVKIMHVPPFELENIDTIENHQEDLGILEVGQTIQQFPAQETLLQQLLRRIGLKSISS